jgi:hypothetical protein
MEYGPTPPPLPPVPPLPGTARTPLQAASASELRITGVKRENFRKDFIAIDCSFDTPCSEKRRRIFHALAFPALLEKDFVPSKPGVEPWLFNERRPAIALRHLLAEYWD